MLSIMDKLDIIIPFKASPYNIDLTCKIIENLKMRERLNIRKKQS